MKTKIAWVIPTMDRGGAEKQLCLLARHLPRDQFDPHVFLLTRDGPLSQTLRDDDIPVTLIGKRFKADPTALFRLRKELLRLNPDIVHTYLFAANSFGRMAALMANVKTIIASERCVDPWKTNWQFIIDRWLAKRSAAITTNSNGVKDFYQQRGIPGDLFKVIPNGIASAGSVESFASRSEICERLQVDPARKLIVAVGRLWPQKRYRDLIWAAELVATLRNDTTLVIIGDGPQSNELMRYRDSVSIPQHVRFAGHRDDVAEILQHADVFWIGSEYEGQSNSLIEAMQAGVPVVTSDIAGNRDLVVDGVTGFLVELGDTADFARQTHAILGSAELARSMSDAARERIDREFTIEKMIQGHVELYQRCQSR
ncbi:putative glycosyltransferase EpsD [Rubripirellula amarantea]|uniref:Putative glycosyltransferase EpsD n=1 Tax=Rubripirellula amarantea TaxID=2527999 RepID=A0A5C5WKW6_9BACT|nr:glycosyltransferase [Rubripirellula amarantea]TWT50691.1 putative glycosyltransferase EpsD [Rubripirellula amarantea]